MPSSKEVSQLLVDWGNGDKDALDKLVPVVYQELRRLARRHMRGERPGHTLQTSALVNEAYVRLIDYKNMQWQNRAHFFAVASQVMRRVLVESARSRHALKREGAARKVSLEGAAVVSEDRDKEILALDEALVLLEKLDPRKSQIVELRFFGGLSIEEAAEVLKVSPTTVQREWRSAKAWLYRNIREGESDGG